MYKGMCVIYIYMYTLHDPQEDMNLVQLVLVFSLVKYYCIGITAHEKIESVLLQGIHVVVNSGSNQVLVIRYNSFTLRVFIFCSVIVLNLIEVEKG